MGRILLLAGAALLAVTAAIHALGQPMVERWAQGLGDEQKAAMSLVWVTDSISWLVVALIWAAAGWKPERGWLGASALGLVIPLSMVVGIMRIDPTFFGGWMLLGSAALAMAGLASIGRS